jgi:hypothetical protein
LLVGSECGTAEVSLRGYTEKRFVDIGAGRLGYLSTDLTRRCSLPPDQIHS